MSQLEALPLKPGPPVTPPPQAVAGAGGGGQRAEPANMRGGWERFSDFVASGSAWMPGTRPGTTAVITF